MGDSGAAGPGSRISALGGSSPLAREEPATQRAHCRTVTWNSPPSPASGGQGLRPPGRLQAPLTFTRDPFEGQKFDGVGGVVAPSVGGAGCADPVLAPACPTVPRNPQPWSYSKPSSLGSFGVGGPLPNKCPEHEGTSPFPWSLGSRSAYLFLVVRSEGRPARERRG